MISKIKSKIQHDSNFRLLIGGSLQTLVIKSLGILLGFVLLFVLTSKLEPVGVGQYQVFIQFLIVLSTIGSMGLKNSTLRYSSQYYQNCPHPNHRLLYFLSIKTTILICIIIGLLILAMKYYSAKIGFKVLSETPISIVVILIVALPFFTIHQIQIELLRGIHKFKSSEILRNILIPLLTITGVMLFLNKDASSLTPILIYTVSIIITAGLTVGYAGVTLSNARIDGVISILKSDVIKTSIPMLLSDVGQALITTLPFFLLYIFGSEREVGLFTVPYRIASMITVVLVVVNTVSGPKFSFLFWNKSREELQRFTNYSVSLATLVAVVPVTFLLILSPQILSIFGNEYTEQSMILRLLVLGQFINVISGSNGLLLNMSGHEKIIRNILWVSITFLSLTGVFFTLNFGGLGAAIAFLITQFVWNILAIYYAKKKLNVLTFFRFKALFS